MTAAKTADLLVEGDHFEPLSLVVSEEMNESYLQAIEDFSARYVASTSGGVPPLVHPALLINFSNHTRSPSFRLPYGVAAVHASEEVEFLGRAEVGEKLEITWRVTGSYERRGRPFQVVEAVVAAAAGPAVRRVSIYTYMGGPYAGASEAST